MRISDWSSDVCSSDLQLFQLAMTDPREMPLEPAVKTQIGLAVGDSTIGNLGHALHSGGRIAVCHCQTRRTRSLSLGGSAGFGAALAAARARSEEHTSELQSLMRISYAVFCLKKKKSNDPTN